MNVLKTRCVKKIRSGNKIVRYVLEDKYYKVYEFTPESLKDKMFFDEVKVENLKVDRAGRLIDIKDYKYHIPRYRLIKACSTRGNMSFAGAPLYYELDPSKRIFGKIYSDTEAQLLDGKIVNLSQYIAAHRMDIRRIRIYTSMFPDIYEEY